jgi:hypothetical protein
VVPEDQGELAKDARAAHRIKCMHLLSRRTRKARCSSCGGVVGVLDHFNIAQLISEFAKKLGARGNRIVSGNLTTDDAEGA